MVPPPVTNTDFNFTGSKSAGKKFKKTVDSMKTIKSHIHTKVVVVLIPNVEQRAVASASVMAITAFSGIS